LKKKYPSARVICIEPESNNFELLKQNTKTYPDIHFHQKGLWSKSTYLNIINPNQSNWAFITKETDDENNYDVHAISVKEIMNQHELDIIDLLKVDIEGSEIELFSKNADEWLGKTKLIIIELHSPECREVCENKMREFGFDHIHARGENDYYANLKYYDTHSRIFS
jgi:FkbM family methyltransferase